MTKLFLFGIFLLLATGLSTAVKIKNGTISPYPYPSPTSMIRPVSPPVTFPTPFPTLSTGCKTGGCSSELCVDQSAKDMASICVYLDEYACFKFSRCERQPGGHCAWTQTSEYQNCLGQLEIRN